jgi:hypothetical protein
MEGVVVYPCKRVNGLESVCMEGNRSRAYHFQEGVGTFSACPSRDKSLLDSANGCVVLDRTKMCLKQW